MSILIGVYQSPDAATVEQDDEARRTIAKAIGEGAELVGEFSEDGEALRMLIEDVSSNAWERCEGGEWQ